VKDKIRAWVEAREASMLADLARLIAIKSVAGEAGEGMPFGEGPAAALGEALAICREHGFAVKNHDGYVATADMNEKETALDILVHLDVVGEGEGWDTDPYKAVVKDGCLYGRGADDDKGPAIEVLYAMRCAREIFAELGIEPRKNVRLILGTDEETGSRDIKYYYERNKAAPHTFTPDAAFPVVNVEKGFYRPRFSKRWETEAVLPRLLFFSGGYRLNVIPSDAKALVAGLDLAAIRSACAPIADRLGVELRLAEAEGGVEVAVSGRAAHASMPEEGINGLTALIEILSNLPLAGCESTKALRQLRDLFPHGDWEGKSAGVAMDDAISGRLTLAFTLLEMDENGLEGYFDARTPLCASEENCRFIIEARLKALGFEVSGGMAPPHHTPADSPFVRTLLKSYELYTGKKGECLSMGGGTYVHEVEGGVAFGAAMPGFTSNLHGANERLNIKDMLTACMIFAQVVCDMCL